MNISYLIENTNHVYIDNRLLEDYQKQTKKPTTAPSGIPAKSNSPKEPKRIGSKNKSPSGGKGGAQHSQKDIIYKVPKNKPPNSKVFSEEECVEILSAKIIEIQSKQATMQSQYTGVIDKLQAEIIRRDEEYDKQVKELMKVKEQLFETKKDIEALIDIVKSSQDGSKASKGIGQTNARSMKELS